MAEIAPTISAKANPNARLNCLPALELGVVVHQHVHLQRRRVDAALAALLALHLSVMEKKWSSFNRAFGSFNNRKIFLSLREWLKRKYLELHS